MPKKSLLWICTLALLSCISNNASAEEDSINKKDPLKKEAGTVLQKPEKPTYQASIAPQMNITSVLSTPEEKNKEEETEIYFSADEVENNQEMQVVTATGNVNIIRNNLTLIADKVIYNQKEDIVTATGNVILVEKDGNVVFSDYVELTDQMTQGSMDNIKVIMQNKARIAATKFRRLAKDNKLMTNAVYTPCDVCAGKDPLWQIKATKVQHDAEAKNVNYQNATIELKGVPIFYTPFFSHPDPTVKSRSGFLMPSFRSNSYLGAAIQPKYFWDISPNQNFLYSPILSSDHGIVQSGTYSQYFTNGEVEATGTYLKDDDDDRQRGSLFMTGRYELNDYWVGNLDINYASDRAYLKDMSLPKKDDAWLTSSAKLEGFDFRNYAAIEAYTYKLLSYDLKEIDKPLIMPWFNYENIGEIGPYGAYNKNTFNGAVISRDDENSSQRISMINSWVLPYTSEYGEKYRLMASVKSDLYNIDDYKNYKGETFDGGVARVFPQLGLEWKLPFIRATETSRQIIEPTIVAVAAPNGGNKLDKIPNDDSQDVELDDTNILDIDRYAGYDRNDTGSRISYGLNWSAYGNRTGRTSAFIAQSYNFDKTSSFSTSDDQSGRFSDYVGRINASPSQYLDLNYRFKLDKDSLDFKYNELSANFGPKALRMYVSYIFLKDYNNDNTSSSLYGERKELYTGVRMDLTRDWSLSLYNRQDLAEGSFSLEHGGMLTYEDECFALSIVADRNNADSPDYDGDFEISVNFFLKTLGGAGTQK